jgi:arginine-tRNA-protein transferase
MNQDTTRHFALYLTEAHSCVYLADQLSRTLFVDPHALMDGFSYQALINKGFRRSGAHVYRPHCDHCNACVPVRIPVAAFQPNRSQRRNWQRNVAAITSVDTPAVFNSAHFDLYCRYLAARHPDGDMAEDASAENYQNFLVEPWGGVTRFIEFWLADQLIGVAVTDQLEYGLSAVYTFFDPEIAERAPGVFAILTQIELARRLALPYLYLGYWIRDCQKMAYKTRFQPLEAWNGLDWQIFAPPKKAPL